MTGIRTTIAELRELEAKATPVEWAWKADTDGYLSLSNYDAMVIYLFDSWTGYAECGQSLRMEIEPADAALIAASRNALPQLLDYIAKLEAVADAARTAQYVKLEKALERVFGGM